MSTLYAPGDKVGGRYTIVSFLAAGGMQEVYVASDELLPRRVALKTPKNDAAAKRFKRSAALSARITHPYVAKTYDYFEVDGRAHLLEELVPGSNLEELRMDYLPMFDPHLLAQFGHQFAKALAASHHVDVVHRDLKPSNIIVERNGGMFTFKVTDFGIAVLTEEELDRAHKSEATMTTSSTMFGALPYMSPEIIEDPKGAGKASDIWAFGAILFTLMSGTLPFGQGLRAIPVIMSGKLPARPGLTQELIQYSGLCDDIWQIIVQCLNVDSQARPTADMLVSSFERLCYAVTPRVEGRVKNFRHASVGDYGFIEECGRDVFFHRESFYAANVEVGNIVLFSAYDAQPRLRAHPIVPIMKRTA